MSRHSWLLLPLIAACSPDTHDDVSTDDTDAAGDTDGTGGTTDTDLAGDTDGPADTDVVQPAALWTESFESPDHAAFGSSALGGGWEGRTSADGVTGAVVARSDSNVVGSTGPAAVDGDQYLALHAHRALLPDDRVVSTRHEVILDVVPAMVEGTTYTLTGSFARVDGLETPSIGGVRLFEPTQKGDVSDGSWPMASSGAAAWLDNSGSASVWQAFSVSFTGTSGNAGQPLRLAFVIQSSGSDVDSVLLVDALELFGE